MYDRLHARRLQDGTKTQGLQEAKVLILWIGAAVDARQHTTKVLWGRTAKQTPSDLMSSIKAAQWLD